MEEQQDRGSDLEAGVRYTESVSRAVQVNFEDEISVGGDSCNAPESLMWFNGWISRSRGP